jgi:outer membrane protein insertion porin family
LGSGSVILAPASAAPPVPAPAPAPAPPLPLAPLAPPAPAPEGQPSRRIIEKINVFDAGGGPVSETFDRLVRETVLGAGVREGQPYDREAVAAAELALQPFAAEFRVRVAWDPKTGVLTFFATERPTLQAVEVRGNRYFSDLEVRGFLEGLIAGTRINEGLIIDRLRQLEKEYRDRNFYFASADFDRDELAKSGKLVIRISEGPRVRVRRIAFEGVQTVPLDALLGQVDTQVRVWPLIPGILDDDRLAADVSKLTEYLIGQGYLDARVGRRVTFTNAERTSAEVVFVIYEGTRYKVRDIKFVREPAADRPQGPEGLVFSDGELLGRLSNQPGKFFTRKKFEDDQKALSDAYGEIGRFETEIEARRPRANEEPGTVDLVYNIKERRQIRVGRINVTGNRDTQNRVVLRVLRRYGLLPGEVYNTVALKKAQDELEDTGLFQQTRDKPFAVGFEPEAPRGNEPDVRDIKADLNERGDTRRYLLQAGFDTNLGIAGRISYQEDNFDITELPDDPREIFNNFIPGRGDSAGRPFSGAGERFRVDLRAGNRRNAATIDWRTPYFLDYDLSAGAGLYVVQTVYIDQYDELRAGPNLSVGKRLGGPFAVELSVNPEVISVYNIREGAGTELSDARGTFFETHFRGQLSVDRRTSEGSDRTNPTTGGDLARLELTPSVGSFQYFETVVRYQRFFSTRVDVENNRDVLSVGGRFGYIFGDVPVFDRFYAGGIGGVGSFRGFEFRGVTPRDGPLNDRVGGKFLLIGSADYSFPLFRTLPLNVRGFGFIDAGTVESDFGLNKFRVSVGPGARIYLPAFGAPLELGVGIPVVKDRLDQRQLFFFSGVVGF